MSTERPAAFWSAPLLALGFLTRLAPAREAAEAEFARVPAWMPAVGLVLGGATVLPFALGLGAGHPVIQAWLAVALSAWLTRGLHYDGLADVLDAAGPHADPERFWAILKDSRAGAFGVLGLVLAVVGQVALLTALFAKGAYVPAAWAVGVSRLCPVLLGLFSRELARPGLGGLFLAGMGPGAVAVGAFTVLAAGVLALPGAVSWPGAGMVLPAAMALACAPLVPLGLLARRMGGVNGDFLGAAIVLGELGAWLGCVLALC